MSFDEWVPGPPPAPTPPPGPGLPPGNSWNPAPGCSTGPNNPSFVYGVVITGVPATILGPYAWGITLNDGSGPPNFTIDHYNGSGVLIDHPLEFSGVDGSATFNHPVTAPALTITTGQLTVPTLGQLTIPGGPVGSYIGSAGGGVLEWFNLPIAADAPSNGNLYGRSNGAWASGGNFTQPLYITGANSFALIGPNQSQRSIMAGTGTGPTAVSWRWQMVLADQTQEVGNNSGSNFALNAIGDGGSLMPGPSALAIVRATNAATFGGTVTVPGQVGGAVPSIIINKGTNQNSVIAGQLNGSNRWTLSLADPTAELGGNFGSNFTITRYTDAGAANGLPPLQINRQTGNTTFAYGVTITGVLTLAAPANLSIGGGTSGQALTTDGAGNLSWSTVAGGGVGEAPVDGTSYARNDAAWVHLTHNDITDWATQLANYYPTSNPSNYQTAAQVSASLAGYLPLTGGTVTGATNINAALWNTGPFYLNSATGNRAIAGMSGTSPRWAMWYGDGTTESGGNVGSNFTLQSYSDAGALLGTPLSINRASSVATFATLPSFPGGSAGNVLTTNGAGVLSWTAGGGSGGISDAPNDGTLYGRKSAAWAHLTHTDITDWTATLAPYALTTNVPVASSTTPLMAGTAAVGAGTTWARADHVHPTDTSRYAASNPSGYQTAAQVTAALPVASTLTPAMNGTAAIGTNAGWSRGDHVHPTDTSRAATSALANYLPLAGGTLTGNLNGTTGIFSGQFTCSQTINNTACYFSYTNAPDFVATATSSVRNLAFRSPTYMLEFDNSAGVLHWLGNATSVFSLDFSGNLTIAGTLTQGSDARGKRDIQEADEGLAEVRQLTPVYYRRNYVQPRDVTPLPDQIELGFVAQDVQDALPLAVREDNEGKLGLALMPLIAALTNAVKELDHRISGLENELASRR